MSTTMHWEAGTDPVTETSEPTELEIAVRAHHLWVVRGCPLGSPERDWLQAEKELKKRQGDSILNTGFLTE